MKTYLIIQGVMAYLFIGAIIGTVSCAIMGEKFDTVWVVECAVAWPLALVIFAVMAICKSIYKYALAPLYTWIKDFHFDNFSEANAILDKADQEIYRMQIENKIISRQMRAAQQRIKCKACPLWKPICENIDDSSDRLTVCKRRDAYLKLVEEEDTTHD